MISRDVVLQQALSLPPEDQAFVAHMLERQLAEMQPASDCIEKSWCEEVDRRIAAYQRGDQPSLDVSDALQQLRRSITEHRRTCGRATSPSRG